MKIHRIEPQRLRDLGLDEAWLQDQVAEDPAILGLGDLNVIERERTQTHGGRLDFLMEDLETDVRYAVEVQLGTLDVSHAIRALVYLAGERKRDPDRQHRAVLVCEEAGRYAEALELCVDHGIPIILIELRALPLPNGEGIVPVATRVLDYEEEDEEDEDGGDAEAETRESWERKSHPEAMEAFDALYALFPVQAPVRYRRRYIAFRPHGTSLWCSPRRREARMVVSIRVPEGERNEWLERAAKCDIPARATSRRGGIRLRLTKADIDREAEFLKAVAMARSEVSSG